MKKFKFRVLAPILIVFLLSGCSQTVETAEPKVVQDLSNLAHIHSVATDGKDIYAATHHGLYVWQGNDWKLRGDDFDIMGLSFNNGTFYASGHPGPLQNLPDPVGVLTSENGGTTWTPLGLTGEVDFHLLEVVNQNFIGVAASHSSVIRSNDGGQNWSNVATPNFTDLSINPQSANELALATSDGILLSKDFGDTYETISTYLDLLLVEWHRNGVFAAAKNKIYKATDFSEEFREINYQFYGVSDIHSEGELVVVMDSKGIHISRDSGETFEQIASL